MIDLKDTCIRAIEVIKEVGVFIKNENQNIGKKDIQIKGRNDLVTYVDTTAEKKLLKGLQEILPDSGFITEEDTPDKLNEKYQWIIDPLDGTTNYIHALPFYAISVALTREDKLILGIVYEITLDECFYAWEGSKSYLNDKAIKVSELSNINDALLATGFPYSNFSRIEPYMHVLRSFIETTRGVRRLGSAAVDLAYVACGRFDGFYEYNLNAWDVAAGAFIVQQAGGNVSDFSGKDNYIFGKEILANNSKIHYNMLKTIQTQFI